MTFRLKDRELQKKLDALSEVHQFSGCLQKACKRQFRDPFDYVRVEFGRTATLDGRSNEFTHVFFILKSDIEECKEYNPKAWNKFPEVEPPEGVLMRVERSDGYKTCAYFKHFEDGSDWMHTNNLCMPKAMSDLIVRFRPWDD